MRRVVAVVSILLGTLTMGLVTAPVVTAGAATPTTTIYDSTGPGASQLTSLAYEATQATEIGDQVRALATEVLPVIRERWSGRTGPDRRRRL